MQGVLLTAAAYRVVNMQCWVHQSKNIFIVTWLQANNIINDIIHLDLWGTKQRLTSWFQPKSEHVTLMESNAIGNQ